MLTFYEKILKNDAMNPKALLGKGKVFEGQGNFKEAKGLYNMVKHLPHADKTQNAIAERYLETLQTKKAAGLKI